MSFPALLNIGLFAALCFLLFSYAGTGQALSRRVLAGLIGGMVFGFYLQFVYGYETPTVQTTLAWTNVVANGYVNLLKLIIMPLILITMIASVLKVEEIRILGSIGGTVVVVLLVTTMIAALLGVLTASVFGLTAEGLAEGAAETAEAAELSTKPSGVASLNIPDLLVSFISTNIFSDLAGTRDVSIISVVVFGLLFGIAAMLVAAENPARGESIRHFIDTTQAVIMRFVKLVILFTPYGVLALITRVIAGSDGTAILTLINFVIASFIAIALMFGVHALLIAMTGNNPLRYFQRVWPLLTFAFTTRSSAASIPLSIRTQMEELDIPAPIASIAASFGATIGQNGCAGIYPAMLAIMVAPTVGIAIDAQFIVTLVLIIAISSFGIAGVGGGATNAALVVLPALGMPVTVVALLISIEPLIDMARTALNVNGSVTSGLVARRVLYGKEGWSG